MVTAQTGILTSNNEGAYAATGGTGERILVDYKEALQDYKVTSLPALQMFTETMSTDTGGKVDITFNLPSMTMEQIDEGSTPQYQHTKLRSERVDVKEWGIAVGVTRRMIEDSRFNEVEMALNEARRAVERHMTKHVVYALFGIGDSTFGTGVNNADIGILTPEAGANSVADFDAGIYGGFIASGGTVGSGRLYDYGLAAAADLQRGHYRSSATASNGGITIGDITASLELINQHGYNADTIVISPKHYKTLLDLADFTANITNGYGYSLDTPVEETSRNGLIGSIFGLNVYVNSYVPPSRFGVFDMSVKPMAYLERRPLTVEEANPGFGIVGSYMSMRYGLKISKPESGVININT